MFVCRSALKKVENTPKWPILLSNHRTAARPDRKSPDTDHGGCVFIICINYETVRPKKQCLMWPDRDRGKEILKHRHNFAVLLCQLNPAASAEEKHLSSGCRLEFQKYITCCTLYVVPTFPSISCSVERLFSHIIFHIIIIFNKSIDLTDNITLYIIFR